jgi:hypothetical protein
MVFGHYLANRLGKIALRLNRHGAELWVMVKGRQVFTGEGSRCTQQMAGKLLQTDVMR